MSEEEVLVVVVVVVEVPERQTGGETGIESDTRETGGSPSPSRTFSRGNF